jgi:hypothetical protein
LDRVWEDILSRPDYGGSCNREMLSSRGITDMLKYGEKVGWSPPGALHTRGDAEVVRFGRSGSRQ